MDAYDFTLNSYAGCLGYWVFGTDLANATGVKWSGRSEKLRPDDAAPRKRWPGALAGHVREQWDVPVPSPAAPGQVLVAVPALVAAKLALHAAMRERDMTAAALADRLGLDEPAVRRLLDPDRRSPIGRIEQALRVVGRRLAVEDRVA